MQMKNGYIEHKRHPAIRIALKVLLVVCALHFLYYLFITSSCDVEHIKTSISSVLGIAVSDLNFVGGGRRCDGIVVFEYLGDKNALYRFRPEVDPDYEEYQKTIDLENEQVKAMMRSVLARLDISVSLEDNAEILTCCSEQLPVPYVIYIAVSGNRAFMFYPI